jgi:phosphoribosylaminoimidazolecarboxamide formyltransferase/IMP cyclohydrolase
MNQDKTPVKRALISVSDKTGVVAFARNLMELGIEIISTGGTSQLLRDANIPVRDVREVTEYPEMMDGRLKTLHPKIHGGILGLRDEHADEAAAHGIEWIDLVVVNLYPFAKTIKNPDASFDDAIENIDIGGPTMLRAGAKNMGWVGVIVDPEDYDIVIAELEAEKSLNFSIRSALALKAFDHVAKYDAVIVNYLHHKISGMPQLTEQTSELDLHPKKHLDLRYGENPHQTASAYKFSGNTSGILSAQQLQGKELSFNNIADADAAVLCLREFSEPACIVVKHANPCGAAVAEDISTAFQRAFNADPVSAFGGIIALNRPCNEEIATFLAKVFVEVIIAPEFTAEALKIFNAKPNLRLLALPVTGAAQSKQDFKFIDGGLLIQDRDTATITKKDLQFVTKRKPDTKEIESLLFAWRIVKHVKSNAILLAKADVTVGVGAGQVSRIDAVEIALRKAGALTEEAVLASDAFFPFRDSIDRIAGTGVRAIIQPGGSIKDNEVISACDEHGIAMVFTGKRCFKH